MIGIGEYTGATFLDDELKSWMAHYHQVPTVVDVGVMTDAVRWVQGKLWVDRLEATIEAHTLAAAEVRERCTIPGTSRAYGVAVPRQAVDEGGAARRPACRPRPRRGADNAEQVWEFADAVGYPIILKPRTGAGALDTTRVDNREQLEAALATFGGQGVTSIAVEEFVEGHEGFYDTLSVNGHAALDFVSHYYPNVLEAMRTRWISPQFVSTNRVDSVADYGELREMGHRVIEALGIGTSATHMEWFFGPKGLRFSEIGCRPPGVGAWDLYSAGNDLDLYREWANAVVHGHVAAARRGGSPAASSRCVPNGTATSPATPASRRCRPGTASGCIDAHLPHRARRTQPVEAGYMANAYVRMRHPTTTSSAGMLDEVGRTDPRARGVTRAVTLLGPQRRPSVQRRRARLDPRQPVATVTAGWQEREAEDAELTSCSAGAAVNLALHARWLDVHERDREYAHAEREHDAVLDELRSLYLGQLDHALRAAYDVAQGKEGRPRWREAALDDALEVVAPGRRAAPGPGPCRPARRSTPRGGRRSGR